MEGIGRSYLMQARYQGDGKVSNCQQQEMYSQAMYGKSAMSFYKRKYSDFNFSSACIFNWFRIEQV